MKFEEYEIEIDEDEKDDLTEKELIALFGIRLASLFKSRHEQCVVNEVMTTTRRLK